MGGENTDWATERDQFAVDLIEGARSVGMRPGKLGSAGQWTRLAGALMRKGWRQPNDALGYETEHA